LLVCTVFHHQSSPTAEQHSKSNFTQNNTSPRSSLLLLWLCIRVYITLISFAIIVICFRYYMLPQLSLLLVFGARMSAFLFRYHFQWRLLF